MTIAILADEDTVVGFELCGVIRSTTYNEATLADDLEQLKGSSILIVTESIGQRIKELKLDTKLQGVMVTIPEKGGTSKAILQDINKLFESAIGVTLKNDDD